MAAVEPTTTTTATTTVTASEYQHQQQKQSHAHHHHIIHCSCDNKGGESQHEHKQQKPQIIETDEPQTHSHLSGHCHYHNQPSKFQQKQRSTTTTPTQTSRAIKKTSQPHSHSHIHVHDQSHSNQASPFNSRQTSPHSHHSHSYHSSPHQSRTKLQQVEQQQQHKIKKPTSPVKNDAPSAHQQHAHHHHHHWRSRQRRAHSHSHAHSHMHNPIKQNCSRKHRSVTDICSNSQNTSCRDVMCPDREFRQLFTRKQCCSSSRSELAQYFAEDLYGSNLRRPSSCCTSSDYCYQTDSTSLYGSRSSHESIKSANLQQTQKKPSQMRISSYTSIPQNGSLVSIYTEQTTRKKKVVLSPSKITIEHYTSKDALSSDLPEYACSPSPIRWSFLGELSDEQDPLKHNSGRKASTASEGREREYQREKSKKNASWKKSVDELPRSSLKSTSTERVCIRKGAKSSTETEKRSTSPFDCNFEETFDTVLFHQEAESFNNCCNNYIQCNTYLDQDLQITSEDIHQYLNKGQEPHSSYKYDGKNYPFQPSNALETQYKNNFADKIDTCSCRLSSSKENNINEKAATTTGSSTILSAEGYHSEYFSNSYTTDDYTNMRSNTALLQPTDHAKSTTSNSNSDDQHSSLLQSPEPVQVSFESFDAASGRKLLSPQTPHSESPCSSTFSVAVNPCSTGPFVHHHHHHQEEQDQYNYANVNEKQAQHQDYHHHHHHHLHHYQHQHQHNNNGDSFNLSHAFRNVRKRARKYTDFLRKK